MSITYVAIRMAKTFLSAKGLIGLKRKMTKDPFHFENLGPVVQSIVSLTGSLRGQLVKWFMTL